MLTWNFRTNTDIVVHYLVKEENIMQAKFLTANLDGNRVLDLCAAP